jgi:hypothetical protein
MHHDASMRTTITLDPDVARLLEDEVHRQRKSFKQVVNDVIRRGLSPRVADRRKGRPYRVAPHHARLRPGFDRAGFNKLADEMEDEGILATRGRRGPTASS